MGSFTHTFISELELANEAGAADKGCDAALHAIFCCALWKSGTVGAATSNHLAALHIFGGVARIHPTDVCAHRTRVAVGVHLAVVEVIGALPVGTELRVVFVGSENEWRSAAPAPHELRGGELLLVGCVAVFAEEVTKGPDVFLHSEVGDVAAVA